MPRFDAAAGRGPAGWHRRLADGGPVEVGNHRQRTGEGEDAVADEGGAGEKWFGRGVGIHCRPASIRGGTGVPPLYGRGRTREREGRRRRFLIRPPGALLAPAPQQVVRHGQLVADAADDEIHQSESTAASCRTPATPAAPRRRPRRRRRGWQLDQVQRRLARQNQFSPLLQVDIGGPVDEVLRQAVRDGRGRAHAARADNHAAGQKGAAGDPGPEVAVVVVVQPAAPRRRRRLAQHVGRVAEQLVGVEGVQPDFAVQSRSITSAADGLMVRWTFRPARRSVSSRRTPYAEPLAPVIATTRSSAAIAAPFPCGPPAIVVLASRRRGTRTAGRRNMTPPVRRNPHTGRPRPRRRGQHGRREPWDCGARSRAGSTSAA